MNHLQNKGFTLVELMVVIVIMGVLAAVGVPKLTSAVAKSKASEVAPAATTYIKLQSAYVMEH
ncbi:MULTISPECIES: type IV pilin protein [unclassified Fibrobacter]|uniref:type IV pilin protein n=1 Tax=unclassified Fibrobacter TaxID=2634177 RepID=UPI000D6B4E69|nr:MULTISPECIES: prepilin-type N-terminal cleavage/methylation domain-containing protein [unclassified Fibrobacter]PWJ59761.1 prepilin-type N-terminal cleavage/methylation domain-containing protein [Fibrobacter sp. UWR4]PZW68027.1 prepilin-type N-terminal cleavage/methylation domain-containing protein [Fibrobacter sp. UWR1]